MSTQTEWETGAAELGLRPLVCGCPGLGVTGQEFYRCVNFMRQRVGLGVTDIMPPRVGPDDYAGLSVFVTLSGPLEVSHAELLGLAPGTNGYISWQTGKGLDNPWTFFQFDGIVGAAEGAQAMLDYLQDTPPVFKVCMWAPQFCPLPIMTLPVAYA